MTSFLRRPQVEACTGLPRSTIYDRMKKGSFPKPISLGKRTVAWLSADIEAWMEQQLKQAGR
jgi:prophage regulatory protein